MKIYEYACHDCKVVWERKYKFGKCANKTKCPECGKRCEQNWLGREAPAVHFKGGLAAGWTTKGGGDLHGSSDQMNKAMQDGCNARMDEGYRAYAKYTPKKQWTEDRITRKLTKEESHKKIEAARKQAAAAYHKAGIDPYKQAKKKPQ